MGYYVAITHSTVVIPSVNIDAAYDAVMALNSRDDIKRGGSWPGSKEPKPEGMEYHPHKWFSWMPANLRELKTLSEVLSALGFGCTGEPGGDILVEFYDNKTGQEDIFFEALAPYIKSGTVMEWEGEDRLLYRWVFEDGVMHLQYGDVTVSWGRSI